VELLLNVDNKISLLLVWHYVHKCLNNIFQRNLVIVLAICWK